MIRFGIYVLKYNTVRNSSLVVALKYSRPFNYNRRIIAIRNLYRRLSWTTRRRKTPSRVKPSTHFGSSPLFKHPRPFSCSSFASIASLTFSKPTTTMTSRRTTRYSIGHLMSRYKTPMRR